MKKSRFSTYSLILVFLVGVSLLLYPTVSDYWNSLHQSRAIAEYAQEVADMGREKYDKLLAEAMEYNETLAKKGNSFYLTKEEKERYNGLLNISGNGVLGYIEIPAINCSLPICHGTDEGTLQSAVGHLEWSSLPVGGKGSHCVISGHRGLPSAKLFTDIDDLRERDIFIIRVLDEMLTYEVDQILIVKPEQIDSLTIDKEKDYCTLVTCTPYGINSHRLLVRGHRIENLQESSDIRITAEAIQIEPLIVATVLAVPMLLILFLLLLVKTRKKPEQDMKYKKGEDSCDNLCETERES